jgi:hypothetical protein
VLELVQDADQSVKNAVTTSISNNGVLTVGTSEASERPALTYHRYCKHECHSQCSFSAACC